MKTRKSAFALIPALFFGLAVSVWSCQDIVDYNVRIPEQVNGEVNLLYNDLSEGASIDKSLIFEYQVANADEYVKIESYCENNRLNSTVSYKKGESVWDDVSHFELNLSKREYRQSMNRLVEKHAEALKKKYDAPTVDRIANILESVPRALYNEISREEYLTETSLSVFYHLAMFSAARRAYETDSDCRCGANDSYLGGESPFFCAEDVLVRADQMYDMIKKMTERTYVGHRFDPKSTLSYLERESGGVIPVSKIDKLFRDEVDVFWKKLSTKEKLQLSNERNTSLTVPVTKSGGEYDGLPIDPVCLMMGVSSGSDCGCCGNYSGPCFKCDIYCLEHDLLCINCLEGTGWEFVCLNGCIPGC